MGLESCSGKLSGLRLERGRVLVNVKTSVQMSDGKIISLGRCTLSLQRKDQVLQVPQEFLSMNG